MSFRPPMARTAAVLLREAQPLSDLLNAAQRLTQLQQTLERQLQPAARPHCQVAAWRDGHLLLIVTDAGWATRLRFQERRLLRYLQLTPEFAGLQRILFKIQLGVVTPQNLPAPQLSLAAAGSLRETAREISDPQLRVALERLASRAR